MRWFFFSNNDLRKSEKNKLNSMNVIKTEFFTEGSEEEKNNYIKMVNLHSRIMFSDFPSIINSVIKKNSVSKFTH